jgi:hypothetical protein
VEPRLFALDHNFPESIVLPIVKAIPVAELVPVRSIGRELAELEDWELLARLHQDDRPWDGLITNDSAMLSQPKELTVLSQTGLTLVVARGEGSNPIRAAGVLLCHLNHICRHTTRERAQIWDLKVAQKNADEPRSYLEKIALRTRTTPEELVRAHRIDTKILREGRAR